MSKALFLGKPSSDYPDLLSEVQRYCGSIEIFLLVSFSFYSEIFGAASKDRQAEKSVFPSRNKMMRVSFKPRLCPSLSQSITALLLFYSATLSTIKARFHYERGKEHSLFVLLIFFVLASILTARFNRRSIKGTKNALFHACSGNGPLK